MSDQGTRGAAGESIPDISARLPGCDSRSEWAEGMDTA